MVRFSERIGVVPTAGPQLESMDIRLRAGVWNVVYDEFFEPFDGLTWIPSEHKQFLRAVWTEFFTGTIDEVPNSGRALLTTLKNYIFGAEWWQVYDLLEFLAAKVDDSDRFCRTVNRVLEERNSGYRFLRRLVVPITDELELAEVGHALGSGGGFAVSAQHLDAALRLLKDAGEPARRNSVKESISAVEAATQVLCGDSTATLGDALKRIDPSAQIHPALKKAFGSLYGYTSNSSGIRHALSDGRSVSLEEARFMLVACSAFVNYLKARAASLGMV